MDGESTEGRKPRHLEALRSRGDLRGQVADGLRCLHGRATQNTAKTMEAASFFYALIEILSEKSLIAIDDLDERKRQVMGRLTKRYEKDGLGVIQQEPQFDKYDFDRAAEIDCEARVHLCRASCCRLPFALSRQDVEERVIRWNFGLPYMIEQGEDGYCAHIDRCTRACTVYAERPVPCRGYDCRQDKRIWLDFDNRIPNPAVERTDWLDVVSTDPAE